MKNLNYLFYGKEPFLINQKVNELINSLKVDSFNTFFYDLIETNHYEILEELTTISFFANEKIVVVKNTEELYKVSERGTKDWISYLSNPNPDTYLIFILMNNIEKNTPFGNALFNFCYIEEVKEGNEEDFKGYIKKHFTENGYTIDNESVDLLVNYIGINYFLFNEEANKLMLYCSDTKIIREINIENLVSKKPEDNVYELSKKILLGETKEAISIYNDLLKNNEKPSLIFNTIVNSIRNLFYVKAYLEQGFSKEQIQTKMGISEGRAYHLIADSKKIEKKRLESYLQQLMELDFQIKSFQIDDKIGIELYILGV